MKELLRLRFGSLCNARACSLVWRLVSLEGVFIRAPTRRRVVRVDRSNGSSVGGAGGGADLDAEGLLFHASLAESPPIHSSSPSHARSTHSLLQKMPATVSPAALQLAGEQRAEVLTAWAAGTNPCPPPQHLQGSGLPSTASAEAAAPPSTVPRVVALAALVRGPYPQPYGICVGVVVVAVFLFNEDVHQECASASVLHSSTTVRSGSRTPS